MTPSAAGCVGDPITIGVIINAFPTIAITNSTTEFCADPGLTIPLEAVIGGSANSVIWSTTNGQGTFSNELLTNTLYFPAPDELLNTTTITFVVSSDDSDGVGGPCMPDSDQINITINPLPNVAINEALFPEQYCILDEPLQLDPFGIPVGGTFSGDGVLDDGNGGFIFDPDSSTIGTSVSIAYSFTDGNGCTNSTNVPIGVIAGPDPGFMVGLPGQPEDMFCISGGGVFLLPTQQGGLFTIDDNLQGDSEFLPQELGVGPHIVSYTIEDPTGLCSATESQTIFVFDDTEVDFTAVPSCLTNEATFQATVNFTIPNDSIVSIEWDFGDNESESDVLSTTHEYDDPGEFLVTLTVQTLGGCSVMDTMTVGVGGFESVDFTSANRCEGNVTSFQSEIAVNAGSVNGIQWNFGDPTTGPDNTATGANVNHVFSSFGTFNVTLVATSTLGCIDSITQEVDILPFITTFPYQVSFEDAQGNPNTEGWVVEFEDDNFSDTLASFELGVPNSNIINEAADGQIAWVTNLDGPHNPNERTLLLGPCFNMSTLESPMVSFEYFLNTQQGFDGVVFEVSEDGGLTWGTLGELNPQFGINWYNEENIASNPSGLGFGNQGWSLQDSVWRNAAFSLEEFTSSSSLMVRFVFASDGGAQFDGFGMDNFRVGSRDRVVLVENFTNLDVPGFEGRNSRLNTIFDTDFSNLVSSNNILGVQYHRSIPAPDSIGERNTVDPSSRGLFYSISDAPLTFIDGMSVPGSIPEEDIVVRALIPPEFDITASFVPNTEEFILDLTASITPLNDFSDNISVHFAIVERIVSNGTDSLDYVLRRLLPNAIGIEFENGFQSRVTENLNVSWQVEDLFDTDELGVVVFVQNNETSEVYQSAFVDVTETKLPGVITNVEDDLEVFTLSVFPNPADQFLNVTTSRINTEDIFYQIIDQRGVILQSGELPAGSQEYEIPVDNLIDGGYYVILQSSDFVAQRKIVILHK